MISFVYFDLGGVIITDLVSNHKWDQLKQSLGINSEQDADFESFFTTYENEVNVGLHHIDEIIPLIKNKFSLNIPDNYSLQTDLVGRFASNPSIWPVIEKVHKSYRVGLLTNIYPGLLSALTPLLPKVNWDIVVDSSVVKLAKPDPKIFALAGELTGVPGSEILFTDNTLRHLQAAQIFGWQTFLYDPAHPEESSQKLNDKIFL